MRRLTVAYGQHRALQDVALHAPRGAVTGVVGPNGAGKSTLLKAVLQLVPAQTGEVTFDGAPVGPQRRRIAYLPQRATVDWDYPAQVGEVVAMGRYPARRRLRRASAQDREVVADALARVGLAKLATRPIRALSGGQQQRMLFARALAQQPALLLLDEPFAGIDAVTEEVLAEVLGELAAAAAAVVLVNHDLARLDALCQRLVLLDGVVHAEGATADVLAPDVLARGYGAAPVWSRRTAGEQAPRRVAEEPPTRRDPDTSPADEPEAALP